MAMTKKVVQHGFPTKGMTGEWICFGKEKRQIMHTI